MNLFAYDFRERVPVVQFAPHIKFVLNAQAIHRREEKVATAIKWLGERYVFARPTQAEALRKPENVRPLKASKK